jgi:large-conductance mechanosensitive channel
MALFHFGSYLSFSFPFIFIGTVVFCFVFIFEREGGKKRYNDNVESIMLSTAAGWR